MDCAVNKRLNLSELNCLNLCERCRLEQNSLFFTPSTALPQRPNTSSIKPLSRLVDGPPDFKDWPVLFLPKLFHLRS